MYVYHTWKNKESTVGYDMVETGILDYDGAKYIHRWNASLAFAMLLQIIRLV